MPTLTVQIRSPETHIAEIYSRIYIMHKAQGATLIMIIKKKPDKLQQEEAGGGEKTQPAVCSRKE